MRFQNNSKAIILLLLAATLLAGCFTRLPDSQQPKSYPGVTEAIFAPDGKSIYFTFTSPKIYGLFQMNLDGKVIAWLSKWRIGGPALSPDSRTLVFAVRTRDDKGDLWAMDSDGKNLRQLTFDSDYDRKPRFSHDGKRIYFMRHDSWGSFSSLDSGKSWDSDIYYLDLTTGKEHRVTDQEFWRLGVLFVFPDDRHILINTPQYLKETGHSIWKINIDDPGKRRPIEPNMQPFSEQPKVTFDEGNILFAMYSLRLSRDGRFLLFAWEDPAHRWGEDPLAGDQIFLTNMEDMSTQKILGDKHYVSPMDISPDNQWILFADSPEKSKFHGGVFVDSNLWMVRRDGSGLKNLKLDFRGVLDKPPAALRLP
ncbi:MAG: hypothetical protein KQI62_18500 [Deltaproteobacteria bacterium]|nr:hypothetical protein [Deltaproteobacteria bacterium]